MEKILVNSIFSIFPQYLSINNNFVIGPTFNLSSANAFSLDRSNLFSIVKELATVSNHVLLSAGDEDFLCVESKNKWWG